MSKIFGNISYYSPVKEDASRIVISYDFAEVGDGENATWHEIAFYKRFNSKPSLQQIKTAVIADINSQTDERILSGFVWEPASGGDPIPVWLSLENQFNFKSAYDLAVQKQGATLPVTFKMGEDSEGTPVYHTFETMEDADDFYLKAVGYINQCLNEGWARKDSIDWSVYEQTFE